MQTPDKTPDFRFSPPITSAIDLFDYVLQEHQRGEAPDQSIEGYIATARAVLSRNQPVATDFVSDGLAIRFQDGLTVPLLAAKPAAESFANGYAPITRHASHAPTTSQSWGVTGAQ